MKKEEYNGFECNPMENNILDSEHDFWEGGDQDILIMVSPDGKRLFKLTKDFGGKYRPFEIEYADTRLYNPIQREEFVAKTGLEVYVVLATEG